jgi:myo-inositol-1(or 4)-monophosphatase
LPGNDADLALLIDAARAAGEIAARHFQRDPDVWHKPGDAGPVTEADIAIDTMLRETLLAARPDYGWLSEETPDTPARLGTRRLFIVDPIDGTRAFIDGSRAFAHSLAVVDDGQVTAGVVFLPMMDKLYASTVGQGATLNGTPIAASVITSEANANVLTTKTNLGANHWPGGVPQITPQFRSSLAYRMSLVAEGRFDAMMTFRDTWEWDIAAGALIAAEAGAVISDGHGGPIRFNNPSAQVAGVVTGAPGLHAALMRRRAA